MKTDNFFDNSPDYAVFSDKFSDIFDISPMWRPDSSSGEEDNSGYDYEDDVDFDYENDRDDGDEYDWGKDEDAYGDEYGDGELYAAPYAGPGENAQDDDRDIGQGSGHRTRLRHNVSRFRLDDLKPMEVLEFLLSCVLPRQDVQPVAHAMMNFFEWDLHRLLAARLDDFIQVPGLGESGAQWMDLFFSSAALFGYLTLEPQVLLSNYRQLRQYCHYLRACFGGSCCLQLLTDENSRLLLCQPLARGENWNNTEIIVNAADMAASMHASNAYIVVFTKSVYRHPNRSDMKALDLYLKLMRHGVCTPQDLLFVDRYHCCSLHAMRKMPRIQTARRHVAEEHFINPPGESLILHRYHAHGSTTVRIPISQLEEVENNHERPEPV